jgi:type IV pilus assembly protein PilW
MVELMVSVVIGLVLVGGMLSVFASSRQALRLNENLARVQEGGRFAVELLVRDIRESGSTPCGTPLTANVVARVSGALPWWASTYDGLVRGFGSSTDSAAISGFGTSAGDRVSNTEAILLLKVATDEAMLRRLASHTPATPVFTDGQGISTGVKDKLENAPVIVCDGQSAALLRVGSINTSSNTYAYGTGTNCSTALGTADASCGGLSTKTFPAGSLISLWDPSFWYVGHNGRGGTSLFRASAAVGSGGAISLSKEEMVPDVADLDVTFLTRDRTAANALATGWKSPDDAAFSGGWNSTNAEIVAVQVGLLLRSPEAAGSDGNPLTRRFVALASLRSREL